MQNATRSGGGSTHEHETVDAQIADLTVGQMTSIIQGAIDAYRALCGPGLADAVVVVERRLGDQLRETGLI
jgi:hypothetical protein